MSRIKSMVLVGTILFTGMIITGSTAQAQLANTPWPSFGNNVENTGLSKYAGAVTDSVKWTINITRGFYSSTAIGPDGTLYAGSETDRLYALSQNGTIKWSFLTGNCVCSTPAIGSAGTIYVGSVDSTLYAINPDGTLKWSYNTNGIIAGSPSVGPAGTVYIGNKDSVLYAINPNGTLKWKFKTGGKIRSAPAIGKDTTIYVGADNTWLYAVNPDGTSKWVFKLSAAPINTSPTISSNGTIYISTGTFLLAVSQQGMLEWLYEMGGTALTSPSVGPKGSIYVGSRDNRLYAFTREGALKWSYRTGRRIRSSPAVGSNGNIYFASLDARLYALTPKGTLKWSLLTKGIVFNQPVIGPDGTIYVGDNDGKFYAVGGIDYPPEDFDLEHPRFETVTSTATPTFKWGSADNREPNDTISYTVQIQKPNEVITRDAGTSTSLTLSNPLSDNTIYSWRVIAEDRQGNKKTNDGNYMTFTIDTSQAPGKFALVTPTDSSVEIKQNPLFYWERPELQEESGSLIYDLKIARSRAYNDVNTISVDTNAHTIDFTLNDNSRYFWNVIASNTKGGSVSSDTLMFWVNTRLEPPLDFQQTAPYNGQDGLSVQPTLTWQKAEDKDPLDVASYTVILATDSSLTRDRRTLDAGTDTSITPSIQLMDNTRYFWTVKATDTDSLTTHSDTLSFIVGTITDMSDKQQLPDRYKLYNPYPSPFNPTTTIKYDLQKNHRSRLEPITFLEGTFVPWSMNDNLPEPTGCSSTPATCLPGNM